MRGERTGHPSPCSGGTHLGVDDILRAWLCSSRMPASACCCSDLCLSHLTWLDERGGGTSGDSGGSLEELVDERPGLPSLRLLSAHCMSGTAEERVRYIAVGRRLLSHVFTSFKHAPAAGNCLARTGMTPNELPRVLRLRILLHSQSIGAVAPCGYSNNPPSLWDLAFDCGCLCSA